jgi:hypothetical protein
MNKEQYKAHLRQRLNEAGENEAGENEAGENEAGENEAGENEAGENEMITRSHSEADIYSMLTRRSDAGEADKEKEKADNNPGYYAATQDQWRRKTSRMGIIDDTHNGKWDISNVGTRSPIYSAYPKMQGNSRGGLDQRMPIFKNYYTFSNVGTIEDRRKIAEALPDLYDRLTRVADENNTSLSFRVPRSYHTLMSHTDSLVVDHQKGLGGPNPAGDIHDTVRQWGKYHGIQFEKRDINTGSQRAIGDPRNDRDPQRGTDSAQGSHYTRLAQVLKLKANDQPNRRIEMTKELVSDISNQMSYLDRQKSDKIHNDINAGRSPYKY